MLTKGHKKPHGQILLMGINIQRKQIFVILGCPFSTL